MPQYNYHGYIIVAPSKYKHKKYDVFQHNKYLLSFGDNRYQHYCDKFGYYSHLNHLDPKRRLLYRMRHQNDNINDPRYPGYWSWNFLW